MPLDAAAHALIHLCNGTGTNLQAAIRLNTDPVRIGTGQRQVPFQCAGQDGLIVFQAAAVCACTQDKVSLVNIVHFLKSRILNNAAIFVPGEHQIAGAKGGIEGRVAGRQAVMHLLPRCDGQVVE